MQQPSILQVEQLIRARKAELGDIDGLLLGELAKQKMLGELMQGEEGSQTSEENTDRSNFTDSYVSESSINS